MNATRAALPTARDARFDAELLLGRTDRYAAEALLHEEAGHLVLRLARLHVLHRRLHSV